MSNTTCKEQHARILHYTLHMQETHTPTHDSYRLASHVSMPLVPAWHLAVYPCARKQNAVTGSVFCDGLPYEKHPRLLCEAVLAVLALWQICKSKLQRAVPLWLAPGAPLAPLRQVSLVGGVAYISEAVCRHASNYLIDHQLQDARQPCTCVSRTPCNMHLVAPTAQC